MTNQYPPRDFNVRVSLNDRMGPDFSTIRENSLQVTVACELPVEGPDMSDIKSAYKPPIKNEHGEDIWVFRETVTAVHTTNHFTSEQLIMEAVGASLVNLGKAIRRYGEIYQGIRRKKK